MASTAPRHTVPYQANSSALSLLGIYIAPLPIVDEPVRARVWCAYSGTTDTINMYTHTHIHNTKRILRILCSGELNKA